MIKPSNADLTINGLRWALDTVDNKYYGSDPLSDEEILALVILEQAAKRFLEIMETEE